MKNSKHSKLCRLAAALLAAALAGMPAAGRAEVTDLASGPLADATTALVLPNMMFMLDNSGSMQWSYMPDENFVRTYYQKVGYRSHLCNKMYYNPNIVYAPPLRADGTPFPDSSFTQAPYDGYRAGAPLVNLNNSFLAWHSNASAAFAPPAGFDSDCWGLNGNECTVNNGANDVIKNQAEAAHYYAYTGTRADKLGNGSTNVNVNNQNRDDCVDDPADNNFASRWTKKVVGPNSGPGGSDERTNFANWFTYYRTRILAMKTAASRAFANVGDNFRIGFITINPGSPVASDQYLALKRFDATQKADWFAKMQAIRPSGGTPLREALSRVGRHYAGVKTGINDGMGADPIQYSCQQNFTLLTTDGFWNGAAGIRIGGAAIGNQDNVEDTAQPIIVKRSIGTFDGNLNGASDTLADVAMYYYKTDLRPAGSTNDAGTDISENNVPKTPREPEVAHQRMITFGLGLGVNGKMVFRSDYETATAGDFAKITTGSAGCTGWQPNNAVCNWPVPSANDPSAIDDLWHAAVNGRGKYFSSQDPDSLRDGISSALAGVSARVGAAAASATSSPNITETSNFIFSSTYRTVTWDGEVISQRIDTVTGEVIPTILWSARTNLEGKVAASSDTRNILMFERANANKLKAFKDNVMTAAEKALFANACLVGNFKLSQCGDLAVADQNKASSSANMVDFLRGQSQFEGSVLRDREFVLGDPVNATPVYVKEPLFGFGEGTPGVPATAYGAFRDAKKNRQAMLYVAANDGMLHALNADTGVEAWAFVPPQVMPNMYKLADKAYANKHEYFVDGSPATMDVFFGGAWHTILVGGFNRGARGYYAMDITDPLAPRALWTFCVNAALCDVTDNDLGLSYGNPVITRRASDGKWVVIVTSGYNNHVAPGNGQGWLYVLDAGTGAVLSKVGTGVGDTTVNCGVNLCGPSGLAKISGYADDFFADGISKFVYGADLWGNVWRFDLQVSPPTLQKIAELRGPDGKPQSVTTRPELSDIAGNRVLIVGTGRYLGVNDLQDPASIPLPYSSTQSVYAIKDSSVNWGNFRNAAGVVQRNLSAITDTLRTITSGGPQNINWATSPGWFLDFDLEAGERVNIDPILVLGTLVLTTNVPSQDACTVGGDSWTYFFDYSSGLYVSSSPDQIGGYKKIGALVVGNVVVRLPSGALRLIQTDVKGDKTTRGVPVGGAAGVGRRVNWRELIR